MSDYVITGKKGNGKSLILVGKIYDTLCAGNPVATNLDLDLEKMLSPWNKTARVIRVPDKPTIFDLNVIGKAYEGKYDESKFGLLGLDELGTWFNSRNWQDKTRKEVIDWFLHARKRHWHSFLLIQNINMLDSQARDSLAEHTAFCRRLDNIRLPIIGPLVQAITGIRLTLPKIHRAKVVIGSEEKTGITSDVWVYRGTHMYDWYDTEQVFVSDYPHGAHSVLPPWYTKGRYMVPRNQEFYMRMTKIYWKRFKSPIAMAAGCLMGVAMASVVALGNMQVKYNDKLAEAQALVDQYKKVDAVPEQEKAIYDPLAGLNRAQIASYKVIGQERDMVIQLQDSDGHTQKFSMFRLLDMGVTVKDRGRCNIELRYNNKSYFPECLHRAETLTM